MIPAASSTDAQKNSGIKVMLIESHSLAFAPKALKQTLINPQKSKMGIVKINFLLEKVKLRARLKIVSTSFQVIRILLERLGKKFNKLKRRCPAFFKKV